MGRQGEANLLPHLVPPSRGEKLEIEVRDGYRLDPTQPLEITITPADAARAGTGGSWVNGALRDFKGDDLVLSWRARGHRRQRADADRLEGNIAGLGNLDLGQGSAR